MTLAWHGDLWDHDDPSLWNERALTSSNKMASIEFRKLCCSIFFLSNKSKRDLKLLYLLTSQVAAMCDVSEAEAAIIYGLEPVRGSGFTWFLLGERWGATGWIGGALVLGRSLENTKREVGEVITFCFHISRNGFSTSPHWLGLVPEKKILIQ